MCIRKTTIGGSIYTVNTLQMTYFSLISKGFVSQHRHLTRERYPYRYQDKRSGLGFWTETVRKHSCVYPVFVDNVRGKQSAQTSPATTSNRAVIVSTRRND